MPWSGGSLAILCGIPLRGSLAVQRERLSAGPGLEESWGKCWVPFCAAQVHYLRDLGALDESQPESSVIVSNYVLGASNCVGTSRFYAQCCVDPCDQLLELRPAKTTILANGKRRGGGRGSVQ